MHVTNEMIKKKLQKNIIITVDFCLNLLKLLSTEALFHVVKLLSQVLFSFVNDVSLNKQELLKKSLLYLGP